MRTPFRLLFLCIAGVCCTLSCALAQWHGDGTQRSESAVELPILPAVPEYHTDMPLDCFVGYIGLDSALRSMEREAIEQFIRETTLDTIKVLARFLYSVIDYDPILFERYGITVNRELRWQLPSQGRSMSPFTVETKLRSRIQNEIAQREPFPRDYGLLLVAPYVLHIRVDDVVIGEDTTYTPKPYVNVACSVLEVFKGQRLPSNCFFPATAAQDNTKQVQPIPPCLLFGYPKGWLTNAGFSDTPSSGTTLRTAQVGEEYIVFLRFIALNQEANDIIPVPNFEPSGGMFLIRDGKVSDPGNTFGIGTQPSLQAFKQRLLERIHDIKHWWLP